MGLQRQEHILMNAHLFGVPHLSSEPKVGIRGSLAEMVCCKNGSKAKLFITEKCKQYLNLKGKLPIH